MEVLLASALIHDPRGPHHGRRCHIGLSGGRIASISEGDVPAADRTMRTENLHVSAGWFDLNCTVGEPGHEYKEDFASAAAAAAGGGFTEVVVMPAETPVTQTRAAVGYVRQRTTGLPVRFWPLAAATVDLAGNDLTEMQDLLAAGAVGFTDGPLHPLQRAEVLVRALQYLAPLGGVLINRPEHWGLSEGGQIHEGPVSVRLGLRGLPALAEDVQLARDLRLLEYAGGRLHVSSLSTAGAVALVRDAKQRGLRVTADVAAHQLAFTDDDLPPFDTSFKVKPPFRGAADRAALLEGLRDGTIDAVTSAHQPHDPEAKELEFDLADFGATGLETAFAALHTHAGEALGLEVILEKLISGPRAVLGRPVPTIREGEPANLTLFDPARAWTPTPATTASKARNNPFYGQPLRGQVLGTVLDHRFNGFNGWNGWEGGK